MDKNNPSLSPVTTFARGRYYPRPMKLHGPIIAYSITSRRKGELPHEEEWPWIPIGQLECCYLCLYGPVMEPHPAFSPLAHRKPAILFAEVGALWRGSIGLANGKCPSSTLFSPAILSVLV